MSKPAALETTTVAKVSGKSPAPCCAPKDCGCVFFGRFYCAWWEPPAVIAEIGGTTASVVVGTLAKNWFLVGFGGGLGAAAVGLHLLVRYYRPFADFDKEDKQVRETTKEIKETAQKTDQIAKEIQERAEKAEAQLKAVEEQRRKWDEQRAAMEKQIAEYQSQNETLRASAAQISETQQKLQAALKAAQEELTQYKAFITTFNAQNEALVKTLGQAAQKEKELVRIDVKLDKEVDKADTDFKEKESQLDVELQKAEALKNQISVLLNQQMQLLQQKTKQLEEVQAQLASTEASFQTQIAALKQEREQEQQGLQQLRESILREQKEKEEAFAKQKAEITALRDEVHEQVQKLQALASTSSLSGPSSLTSSLDALLQRQAEQNKRIAELLKQSTEDDS